MPDTVADCNHCLADGNIGQPRLKLDDVKCTHRVICKRCGAMGPEEQYCVDAIEAWAKFQHYEHKKAPK